MVRPPELLSWLPFLAIRRRWVSALRRWHIAEMRWRQRGTGDVVERHCPRKRRQVVLAHLGDRLKPGRKLDEGGLAERGSEEADAEWRAEHHTRRNLHDGITGPGRKPRGAENEVIAEDQIGGPGRIVGGADHCVEIELAQRCVDAVDPGILVNGKC